MWPILPSVTPISKCDNFDKFDPCLESVTHLPKFDSFGQMWPILPSVTRTSKCDNIDKCDPFYRLWLTFPLGQTRPNVTHIAQCDSYFQVQQFW